MTKANNLRSYPSLVLTTSKFMANYYNIHNENIRKFSHDDLNQVFPYIELAAPEDLTKENLVTGDIILVIDSKNLILGYVNPYVYYYEEEEDVIVEDVSSMDVVISVDDDIDVLEEVDEDILKDLNIYELECLLKLCKANQDYKGKRLIQKELYFRPDNHSKEKKNKRLEKVRIREIRRDELK